jgi:hypothetical protein
MKYTNKKNNIQEILKVYIINSITKSYILNIKIRPLVTEYASMIKLVDGTSSAHSFNPYAYFGHLWSYFDIQNLRLVILCVFEELLASIGRFDSGKYFLSDMLVKLHLSPSNPQLKQQLFKYNIVIP